MNEKMQWLFVGLLGLLLNFFVVQTAYVLTIGQADGAPLSGKGIVLGILILFLPNVAFIQLALATKWQLQDLQLAGFAVVGTMLVILPTFLFNTMSYIFAMLLIAAGLVLFRPYRTGSTTSDVMKKTTNERNVRSLVVLLCSIEK